MESPLHNPVLWITGSPGSGKSMLASFLIDSFALQQRMDCVYYFFRFGNQIMCSVGSLLRSLAFQIAQKNMAYSKYLQHLSEKGLRFDKDEVMTIWQKLFLAEPAQIAFSSPMNVIIDGLDELDSPNSFLNLISSKPSNIPLRLLVISRSDPALSGSFENFPKSMPVTRLMVESNKNDLSLFAEQRLQAIHGDDSLHRTIIARVLEKASGNFLWVNLVVQEILERHTQPDIEHALQEIPTGMHSIYERMEDRMAKTLKRFDRNLARALLTWVNCSTRALSLEELSSAVEAKFPRIIDLKHTILSICGNFLVVDRNSYACVVHQTAKAYLTTHSTGVFAIEPSQAHEELFLRCMSCLCHQGLRSQIGTTDSPALSTYAAISWFVHLELCPTKSQITLFCLASFLQQSSILSWIQLLAMQNQLVLLEQASRSLSAFVERKRSLSTNEALEPQAREALDLINLWSLDLVKLLGRFGQNLLDTPESIFKYIPQFCPQVSRISRQFGQDSTFRVSISGEANAMWDDNLTKIPLGAGSGAVDISCSNRYVAILATTSLVSIWDSITFQKTQEILPTERVDAMSVSVSGGMIATYGCEHLKIWDVLGGKELHSVHHACRSRILSLTFSQHDTEVLVGREDRLVMRFLFYENPPTWIKTTLTPFRVEEILKENRLFVQSASHLAFDPSGEQIALGSRGAPLSVWRARDGKPISQCRRYRKDSRYANARPWTVVKQIIWHPRSGEILGIYDDTTVFKWYPIEDSSHDLALSGQSIACSANGRLLAVSADGSITISTYPELSALWQIDCEYIVSSLIFSLDSQRLYVTEGSVCHVWEPSNLVRFHDRDVEVKEGPCDALVHSRSRTVIATISSVAVAPQGDLYCVANMGGMVRLLHHVGPDTLEIWQYQIDGPLSTVTHITWSQDTKNIALYTLGRKILVISLQIAVLPGSSDRVTSQTILEAEARPSTWGTEALLLNEDSSLLLVASPAFAWIYSVKSGVCIALWEPDFTNDISGWMQHPHYSDQLLTAGTDVLISWNWRDLAQKSVVRIHVLEEYKERIYGGRRHMQDILSQRWPNLGNRTMFTQDHAHLMMDMAKLSSGIFSGGQLLILEEADLCHGLSHVSPFGLPLPLLSKVQYPLGILPTRRLVFLDNDCWICSWRLDPGDDDACVERHFFVPRGWLGAENLQFCSLSSNGTLVFPKDGEIVSIKSNLGPDW